MVNMPVPGTIKIHSGLTSIETKLDLRLMLKTVSSSSLLKTTSLTSMPTQYLTRMMLTFTQLQPLKVTLVDGLNSTLRSLNNQMDSLVLISIPQECILVDVRYPVLQG